MPTKTLGTSGTITTSETDIVALVTLDAYHSCEIDISAIAEGDSYVFRQYTYDDQGTSQVLENIMPINGKQDQVMLRFNPVATSNFRITAQNISGTTRTFNFTRWV